MQKNNPNLKNHCSCYVSQKLSELLNEKSIFTHFKDESLYVSELNLKINYYEHKFLLNNRITFDSNVEELIYEITKQIGSIRPFNLPDISHVSSGIKNSTCNLQRLI